MFRTDPDELADARRVQGYASAIDRASQATGYGATGGLMIGSASTEDAKNAVLAASYDQLVWVVLVVPATRKPSASFRTS